MSQDPARTGPPNDKAFAVTQVDDAINHTKQERDIAFAAALLEAAVLSERELASRLATWTLHGSITLGQHLIQSGAIDQRMCSELEHRAAARLKTVSESTIANDGNGKRGSTLTRAPWERLDESGRVAKLLGISGGVSGVKSDESREHATRYQLIRKLGQGGLGTVWLARDISLQRYVALKEIRNARGASQAAIDRFRREAEITGRLEHPGIVPVYQLGEDVRTGQLFYAMRFLGKQTLQDAIVQYHERRQEGNDDPMLLRHLLTAFVSVCQAVGHAHSRKVIHRDLKPENVAIDSFGQVIVIDWGLAKVLEEGMLDDGLDTGLSDVSDGQRTMAGQVLGSPLYMAPEQAAGRVDEIDESTDIFGLGAILFAILTGCAPHEKSRVSSGSTTTRDLVTAIAGGPTPMAHLSNPDVDPALEAIAAKAMARRRYARYSSTTELAEDVGRWMAGEPVTAYQERFAQRLGRWIQHHQRLSQLIAAAVIILIVAATTLMIAARQSYVAARQAQFEEMRSDQREVEVQLLGAGQDLSGDVRFMSTLPPIQGIIDARGGVEGSEGEEIWRGRLETIYEGLLRANSDYLAVSYIAAEQQGLKEIVRVERHSSDQGYIRRVPESRLASYDITPLITAAMEMDPGDVRISLDDQEATSQRRRARRLVAAVPVYDEASGDAFGLVTIETDVVRRIQDILSGLDDRLSQIYITDEQGDVLVQDDPEFGIEIVTRRTNVAELVSETRGFFDEDTRERFLTDGESFTAHRVQLDPVNGSCSLGVVHELAVDE